MKKLINCGGDGIPKRGKKGGIYSVKYGDEQEKTFGSLKDAVAFFNSIDGEKAIWDITAIPELLDCYGFER